MVDAANPVGKFIFGDADVFRQFGSGTLDTVANPNIFNGGVIINRPADNGQRIGVIDEQCIRADLLHITADIHDHRHITQPEEDAEGTDRIAGAFNYAVLIGNISIRSRGNPTANPDRDEDIIRAF